MAYITKEEVSEIRKALKKEFPKIKFSIRKEHSSTVNVSIVKSDIDFSYLFNDEYSQEKQYCTINVFHIAKNQSKHEDLFEKIIDIIKTAPANAEHGSAWYDDSDVMTDYFNTAFYFNLSIGAWNKPYQMV